MKIVFILLFIFFSFTCSAQLAGLSSASEAIEAVKPLGINSETMTQATKEMIVEQIAPQPVKPKPKQLSPEEKNAYKRGVEDTKKYYANQKEKQLNKYLLIVDNFEVVYIPSFTTSIGYVVGCDNCTPINSKSTINVNFGMNFMKQKVNGLYLKHVNLISVGFNMNVDAKLNAFISPINFTFQNGLNAGIAVQPTRTNSKGGSTVLTLGIEF